jgi:pheromone shutdown protein TraB
MYRGELLSYLVNTEYAIAGALLGVPPGQEFRAAIQAAERVPFSAL